MSKLANSLPNNPASFFHNSPRELLDNRDFSRDEKLKMLDDWAYDERVKSVAEEENMPAQNANHTSKLSEVLDALQELGQTSDQRRPPPTKQG